MQSWVGTSASEDDDSDPDEYFLHYHPSSVSSRSHSNISGSSSSNNDLFNYHNFCFGRTGVGGLAVFRDFLEGAVAPLEEWNNWGERYYESCSLEEEVVRLSLGSFQVHDYNESDDHERTLSDPSNIGDFYSGRDQYDYSDTSESEDSSYGDSSSSSFERGRSRTPAMFQSAKQIAAGGDAYRKRSKSSKPEKGVSRDKDEETPEEKEIRRRRKKEERGARKEAEAAALLGLPRIRSTHRSKNKGKEAKGKERESRSRSQDSDRDRRASSQQSYGSGESAREKRKKKAPVDEMISGIQRRKHSDSSSYRKAVSPKREVRSKHHTSNSSKGVISLNISKGSRRESEHRHHGHHEHETLADAAACGRCVRRQRRREERADIGPVAGAAAAVAPVATTAPTTATRERREVPPARTSRTRSESRDRTSAPVLQPPPRQTQRSQRPTQNPALGFVIEKKPEKLIECVTCLENDVPAKEAAKLSCGHWFCNECLKRLFTLSLTDPAHMPPKCCGGDHIPLKHVDKLLSYQTKKQWNKKYLEYTTANRIYCPTTDCGEWIPPKDIYNNIGRCPKCRTKVCSMCNGKAHGDGECPKDEDLQKFIETAKQNKYQRCYNCRAMVELEKGCNHMYAPDPHEDESLDSGLQTLISSGHARALLNFATSAVASGKPAIALGSITSPMMMMNMLYQSGMIGGLFQPTCSSGERAVSVRGPSSSVKTKPLPGAWPESWAEGGREPVA